MSNESQKDTKLGRCVSRETSHQKSHSNHPPEKQLIQNKHGANLSKQVQIPYF
ncbi:hypothetical protein GCM10007932_19590 [Vibrio penaeicida]|uniref:Uncharacterized protein n=1 Tax=Vibrio penaeicida TaxID=104609 RepID=A0AAV5NQF1_9VIBR|nr:hypothetical protein GCM10007932_19590 [Vibrio penaeicida]